MDVTAHLEQVLRQFGSDAAGGGRAMREVLARDAAAFREAAVQALDSFEDGAGYTCLLRLLGEAGFIVPCLLESASRDRERLPEILRAAQRVYPLFPVKLGDLLAGCPDQAPREQERMLLNGFHLIEASASKLINLRLLKRLLDSPNGRIRSMAARMLGQGTKSPHWLAEVLNDGDARVRANAVEALWNIDGPEAVSIFQYAAQDAVSRVAANALVGLYLAGKAEALAGIDYMAQDKDPDRRATAAWAMGRTGDRRFAAWLKKLIQDQHALVRASAIRAVTRIRKAPAQLKAGSACDVVVIQTASGLIRFVLAPAERTAPAEIRPLDTILEIGSRPVLRYTLEQCTAPDRKAVALLAPNLAAGRLPLTQSFAKAIQARRPDDTWAVVPYAAAGGSSPSTPRLPWMRDNAALQRIFSVRGPIEDAAGGLFETLLLCAEAMRKMSFERHIVLMAADGDIDAASPELLSQIQELAAKERILVHAVMCEEPSPAIATVRDLCRKTGGLLASSRAPSAVDSLMRGLTAHHLLRYDAAGAAGPAVLAIGTAQGVARAQLPL